MTPHATAPATGSRSRSHGSRDRRTGAVGTAGVAVFTAPAAGPESGRAVPLADDRSALGINTRRILVIPSIVVRSEGINLFGWRR